VQTECLQEGIADIFPIGQILAATLMAGQRIAHGLGKCLPVGQDHLEQGPEIGIGIEYRQDSQRSDGEEGKGIVGAAGHDNLLQTGGMWQIHIPSHPVRL
jgi:hypothetical protein